MSHRFRLLSAGAVAAAAALLGAGSAHASPLTGLTAPCGSPQVSQPFAPWGDYDNYFLAPNGNFASGGAGWSLAGGAAVVAGGDGYSLAGAAPSTQSLSLPAGSSATTPGICVALNDPDVRMLAETDGGSNSDLQVNATFTIADRATVTTTVANLTAGSSWSPTSLIPVLANLVPGSSVQLTFTPVGSGTWQIDDLYVDPCGMGG